MEDDPRPGRRQSVQSAQNGADILKALAALGPSVALSHLGDAVGMPAAKAHRYLQALMASGLAMQDPLTGRYQLGPDMVAIGLAALGRMDVVAAADRHLPALRDAIGQTCFLAVWGNHGATVVRVMEARGTVTIVTRVGSVLPLLGSATGLAFAAFLDPADRADAPDAEMLATIRAQGTAAVHGLLVPGIDALAVPVFGEGRRVAAVLTALGPQGGFDSTQGGPVWRHLHAASAAITTALGISRHPSGEPS